MKSPSIPPGKMNLRTQFFKARRLAMALAITGGLFLTAAAQGQAVLTDLGSNAVTGYVLPATVSAADISHLTEDLWVPIGSSVGYNIPTTGFGYSWNNNNISPGETFTTGNNAGGYELTSVSLQTGGPTNNDSGTDVNEPFTLTIYQIVPAGATTNCQVVTCYTANGTLTNAGDWFSWTGLAVDLQPNTTYAYGFCEASSSTAGNNWDVYMVDTNNPNVFNANEAIAQFPDAGGVVNFGVNSSTNATIYYTATFDIGLTTPAGPAVPNTPAVSSPLLPLPIPYGIVQGGTTVPLGTITLVSAVGGAQPFTYQWLSASGTNKLTKINGATGSTLDVNTYTIPTGSSNAYAYIAYNPVSTAGVTSAVEFLVAAYPSMVDLGTLAAWQGGGAAPPTVGANDISQMSTASNQYANTSITMRDDGGFQNGLWPAQTFTTKPAVQIITSIVTNIVGVNTNYTTNFATASGWQTTSLSVKTAGGGNFVLDGGWGTGFAIAGNLYDVAFYSLSGTGNTNATLIAGPYKYYGKGTENNWMQFPALNVDLAPNATYAWVWDLDAGNQNLSTGANSPTDIYEDIWVTGGSPTLEGGGASGAGQIAVIQSPNAETGVSGQVIPNQGAVQYNNPPNTYDVTFDLGLAPLPQPVVFQPTYTPNVTPIYAGTVVNFTESAVGSGTLSYQWRTDGGLGILPAVLTNIPGATSSTYSVDTTAPFGLWNASPYANPYLYEVVVANNLGSSTSSVLSLNVVSAAAPMPGQGPPANSEVYVGEPVSYSQSWTGTLPISYQWYAFLTNGNQGPNGDNSIPSATSATLTLSNPQFSDVGTYSVTAQNSAGGPILGASVTLNVLPLPPALNSTTYGALAVSDSPYAYWTLNETNDPSTGILPVYDSSGHGYIGVYGTTAQNGYNNIVGPQPSSSPTPFPGFSVTNTALQSTYQDPNSIVTLPALNLNSSSVTLTAWINPYTNVPANAGLLMYRKGSDASGFGFGNVVNAAGTAELGYIWNNVPATYNFYSGLYPQTNVWSFVALVIQPTQATLYLCYIDPVSGATNLLFATNAVPTNGPDAYGFGPGGTFLIGSDSNSITNRTFPGSISQVGVYASALTSAQILAQFSAATGLPAGSFAPCISGAPNSGAGYMGEAATLSITGALGAPTIGYQWQLNGANLANGANFLGVNSSTLYISSFSALDVGTYTVVAQNNEGTATSRPAVVTLATPVLIGQWLNGPGNFNDQSGYTPAHNGVIFSNGYAWSTDVPTGTSGQSLSLTGGTALIITNTAFADNNYDTTFDNLIHNAFTVMFWAKGYPGTWNPWVSKYGDGNVGWQLRENGDGANEPCWTVRDNTAGFFTLGFGDNTDDMATTTTSNDGNWHHYAGSFNAFSGERDLYLDGVLVAQEGGDVPYNMATNEHVAIGCQDQSGTTFANFLTGKIYDVRVYNYALTQPEVIVKQNSDYVTPVLLNSAIAVTTNSVAGMGYYGGKFKLTFNAKALYSAPSVNGPWTLVSTTSPYTATMTNAEVFFRLENP